MTTQTLPAISPSLQAAIRAYGLENGWKNAARELAYGPVTEAPLAQSYSAPATPTVKRNSHKTERKPKTPTLASVVKEAMRHVGKGSYLPAIGNVLLEPDGDCISVTATDLEVTWQASAPGTINAACLVAPKSLLAAINGHTDLVYGERQLRVGDTKLAAQDADDFPPTPALMDAQTYTLPQEWTARAKRIAVACQTDDGRPALCAMQYNPESGTMTAADGFVLRTIGPRENGGILIPRQAITAIPADVHTLRVAGSNAQFIGESAKVTTQLTQASFPNYVQLITRDDEWAVDVNAGAMRDALLACKAIAGEGAGIVRLQAADGRLVVSAKAEEIGDTSQELEAETQGQAKVAVNINYLLASVGAVGARFRFAGTSPSNPIRVDDDDYCEMVMPMFVNW